MVKIFVVKLYVLYLQNKCNLIYFTIPVHANRVRLHVRHAVQVAADLQEQLLAVPLLRLRSADEPLHH